MSTKFFIQIYFGSISIIVGLVVLVLLFGQTKTKCEDTAKAKCVPVCIKKFASACRKDTEMNNKALEYATCLQNTCRPACELMALSECYLPEVDRLNWK